MDNFTILIVDDEENIRLSLGGLLTEEGYTVLTAANGEDAIQLIKAKDIDMVFLDVRMPGMNGLEVLKHIRKPKPELRVVMISAFGNTDTVVQAMRLGAYNFIDKPFSKPEELERIFAVIQEIFQEYQLKQENRELRRRLDDKTDELIGQSPAMLQLLDEIERAAPTNGRVLISGENGTGKELVARLIHEKSLRADKPFVKVNCAAIPEDLIESELFGHERGAFTGATARRDGKFLQADGGMLFLDEIGDMSLATQAKVLRALQEGEIQRVGGRDVMQVEVRVIAATNKNLIEEIEARSFRDDLYYRLNVIPIEVPPLRERLEDISLLVSYFITRFCRENGKRTKHISDGAMQLLMTYHWPGNVRELKNILERLIIMIPDDVITPSDVQEALPIADTNITASTGDSLRERVEEYEKQFVLQELHVSNGNIAQTARKLHVDRANLHRKLRNWGISREDM
ncbi:MAG: sigma-54-dependent Fis family transcriptional regulator [Deltaproteobacteria bacterium]|nr:sigma-54-dependent Fis family transcriptional regulator [Deltaproteobacteria bacterium]